MSNKSVISSNCHTTDQLVDYQVESKNHGLGRNQQSMIKSFKTKAKLAHLNRNVRSSEAPKLKHPEFFLYLNLWAKKSLRKKIKALFGSNNTRFSFIYLINKNPFIQKNQTHGENMKFHNSIAFLHQASISKKIL